MHLKMQSSWMFPMGSESGDRCSCQRLSGEPGPRDESAEEKAKSRMARSNVKSHQVWKK